MFVSYFTCTVTILAVSMLHVHVHVHDSLPPSLLRNNVPSHSTTGAIELSVFSEYYHIELDVVDVQSQRIDRFGEWYMQYEVITGKYH